MRPNRPAPGRIARMARGGRFLLLVLLTCRAFSDPFPLDWQDRWHHVRSEGAAVRNASGVLDVDATPRKHEYFSGGEDLRDCSVSARVKFLRADGKYSGFSIYLRWSGDAWGQRDGYWVYLRPKFRSLHMQRINGGRLDKEFPTRVKATRPSATPLDEWHALRCEVRGAAISVFLNGEKCLTADDDDPFTIRRGRVAFGVGDAHVLVADMTQVDLEDAQRLDGVTYRYVNPPTRGDAGGNALTDGVVGSGEAQTFWRMLGARPEMIFELGDETFLTKVQLKAVSSPAVNIASADLFGRGEDGEWAALASLQNQDSRRAVAEHQLVGEVHRIARTVKLVLNRPAADQDVELAEVEFFGRKPTEEDRRQVTEVVYDVGRSMPEPTEDTRADANYWYLAGDSMRAAVCRRRGLVAGVWHVRHGVKCIERLPDTYTLVTRSESRETSEYDDIVTEVEQTESGSTLTLCCTNPGLPEITVRKTYSLSPEGGRLAKRVAFTSSSVATDRFLTHGTSGILSQAFRTGGVYMGGDRGLGARLFADDVTVPRQISALGARNAKAVVFIRYDLGWGLGQYRYKVNDHYCRPLTSRWHEKENHPPVYLPNGWSFGLCTLHLAPGREQSTEVHTTVFDGRQLDFYRQYRHLPEVAATYESVRRPPWVRELKTSCDVALNPLCGDLTGPLLPVRRTLQMTETGGLWTVQQLHGVWGEWFSEGTVTSGYGARMETGWLKQFIREAKRLSPRIRTGVYTWAWAVHPRSMVFREHPDWFITKDRSGQVFNAYSNMVLNHARRLGIRESFDELVGQFARVARDFGGDFFYLDGGGGGQNLIDWEHLGCDQDYHYEALYRRIREVTQACGDDKAVWFNARTGAYWDIGYYEGIDRMLHAATWRDSADGLSAVKIRQVLDPGQIVIPLYWRPSTLPFLSNYCIGLGITPPSPLGAEQQRRKQPFIEAAFENRGLQWIEGDLQPDWRTDSRTVVEAYALRKSGAAVLSIIDHREDADAIAMSADTTKLGLEPGRPLVAWVFAVRDIRNGWPCLPESIRREVHARNGWALDLVGRLLEVVPIERPGDRVTLNVPSEPHLLRMVFLSHSYAGVFSVNGSRLNFWVPQALGASAEATPDPDGRLVRLKARMPAGGGEVVVAAPGGMVPGNGGSDSRAFLVGDRWLRIVRLGEGDHDVELPLAPVPGMGEKSEMAAAGDGKAGEMLEVRTSLQPDCEVAVGVWRDRVLLFTGESRLREGVLRIPIPEQVSEGSIEIDVTEVPANRVGAVGRGRATVKVQGGFEPDLVPVYPPKAGPEVDVREAGMVVRGLRILRQGTMTHDGYDGGLYAMVDPAALRLGGGNVDAPRSRYGYGFAGLELGNARVLDLRIASTFHQAWTFYRSRVSFHPRYTTTFAGLMVDYHTSRGYDRRVALGLGIVNPKRRAARPDWGTARAPEEFVSLGDVVFSGAETELTIDLAEWAPDDWDGRCWLSVGADNVLPARRLLVEVLGNSDTPEGREVVKGESMAVAARPRSYTVRRVERPPRVDGNLGRDEVWQSLPAAVDFRLLGRSGHSTQTTRAWVAYDASVLYVAFECSETEKGALNTAAKKIWNQDAVDIALDVDGDRTDFHQIIVNCRNECEQFDQKGTGAHTAWKVTSAVAKHAGGWFVEVSVPFAEIGVTPGKNSVWTGNFVRYRPEPPVHEIHTWSPMPGDSLLEPGSFGTLTFE